MATRVIPPRILRKVRYNTSSKPLNAPHPSLSPAAAATTAAPSAAVVSPPAAPAAAGEPILNFDDVEKLFAYVPTTKLLTSSAVLHATAVEPAVDLGMWVMRSKLMDVELYRKIVLGAMRRTFYEHFCAGEDAVTAGRSIQALNDAGLRGMLVYGVEDAHDNDACDRNLNGFLHTVDVSRSLPPSSVSFLSIFTSNSFLAKTLFYSSKFLLIIIFILNFSQFHQLCHLIKFFSMTDFIFIFQFEFLFYQFYIAIRVKRSKYKILGMKLRVNVKYGDQNGVFTFFIFYFYAFHVY